MTLAKAIPSDSEAKLVPITVAYGDGIGPEIMTAVLRILEASGAKLEINEIEIGEKVYLSGNTAGIDPKAWDTLRETGVFFKAPITTPQGGGYKSLNVTVRKSLGLYANVRPVASLFPFVETKHPKMDVVIIRENEEDLYAGIEHRQTDEVYQCLKLVSRPGCEKIIRYAFEYARANNRKKVTCFSKDNIMKLTDGLFHKVFDEIAKEYPDIEPEHWIIDIASARLADTPEHFDVIVTTNLYGDIVSDIAAQIAGSVGLAPSANIGASVAMFEAIHGSAPQIAGQGIANPSGLLLAGVMMLVHIGQSATAQKIHNAWLKTIEDGLHTPDIYDASTSTEKVDTKAFADAVIARLGQTPANLKAVTYDGTSKRFKMPQVERRAPVKRDLVGIDVFVQSTENADAVAESLQMAEGHDFELIMITNRGVKVWPQGLPETFCTDHWRCRFMARDNKQPDHSAIASLMDRLAKNNIDFIKTEQLYNFDGKPGYSLGQGQ